MVEMSIYGVSFDLVGKQPIVLLKTADGNRYLPIWIGHPEAAAILMKLQGASAPRPLTHDLLRDLLHNLEVEVEAIVITELVDSIFYAEIRMRRDGRPYIVSSRPSDAIALAVRIGTPIHAEESLLDAEAYVLQDDDEEQEEEQEEVIEKFQRFIEDLRPEDFAS